MKSTNSVSLKDAVAPIDKVIQEFQYVLCMEPIFEGNSCMGSYSKKENESKREIYYTIKIDPQRSQKERTDVSIDAEAHLEGRVINIFDMGGTFNKAPVEAVKEVAKNLKTHIYMLEHLPELKDQEQKVVEIGAIGIALSSPRQIPVLGWFVSSIGNPQLLVDVSNLDRETLRMFDVKGKYGRISFVNIDSYQTVNK